MACRVIGDISLASGINVNSFPQKVIMFSLFLYMFWSVSYYDTDLRSVGNTHYTDTFSE